MPRGDDISVTARREARVGRILLEALVKVILLVGGDWKYGLTMVYGRYNELVNGDYNGL